MTRRPNGPRGTMRSTALMITRSGCLPPRIEPLLRSLRPPGKPVYQRNTLSLALLPVSCTFSALITTTWSPQSMCGV